MEWWLILMLMIGGLIFLMLVGLPVAFAFLLMNTVSAYFLWGGLSGLDGVIRGLFDSITLFALLPLPLFILMGEVMYNSGLVVHLIDTLDKLLGPNARQTRPAGIGWRRALIDDDWRQHG